MELPLYEIKDDDFYDTSKRLQILWDIVEEEKMMLRNIQKALFARHSEISKMYLELKAENDALRDKLQMKEFEYSKHELFGGQRAV
jgi:hypothetical protein